MCGYSSRFAIFHRLIHAVGRTETVQGKVLGSEEMNVEINEQPVYVIGYVYEVPEYGVYEGESFRVGSWMDEGRTVTIEYAAGKPSISQGRLVFSFGAPQGGAV